MDDVSQQNAFVTQPQKDSFQLFDFLFPGGNLAKLCKASLDRKGLQIGFSSSKALNRFKFLQPQPVIYLSGVRQTDLKDLRFLGGIARAAYRMDAAIMTYGTSTGIETFCQRRGIKLIGVNYENKVKYPKVKPTEIDNNQLSNGHTHLFLFQQKNDDIDILNRMRFTIASDICQGASEKYYKCKTVVLFFGYGEQDLSELEVAVEYQCPIIVIQGSSLSNSLIKAIKTAKGVKEEKEEQDQEQQQQQNSSADTNVEQYMDLIKTGNFFYLDNNNSEEIASYVHYFLSVTPYKVEQKQDDDDHDQY